MMRIPDLSLLFSSGETIQYKKNEYILRPEDQPQGVSLITDGLVRAYSVDKRGHTYIHMLLGKGEAFPISWGTGKARRRVGFQAVSDVTMQRLTREVFLERILQDRTHYKLYLDYFTFVLVAYSDRVQNLQYRYASERVAYRLLFLASRFGRRTGNSITIDVPLHYEELANSVNLSTKSVARAMRTFIDKSILESSLGSITIKHIDLLRRELKTIDNESLIELLEDQS